MTVRAACNSATCCSNDRTPRTLVAISEPIATMTTATSASATSTSMMVKPASCGGLRSVDGRVTGNDLDPPRQPVDADFIACIETRQRDGAAAGGAVGEETDRRQRGLPPAGLRQHGV